MQSRGSAELQHLYGPRVHLHSDPFVLSMLARIGSNDTRPPLLLAQLRTAYRVLLSRACASELPCVESTVHTRMSAVTPLGRWTGCIIDPTTQVVIANVMRAGNIPSVVCYEELGGLIDSERLRIDHFYFSRVCDDEGHILRVQSSGSKIGGSVAGAVVIVPDPMGATGGTLVRTVEAYREVDAGAPATVISLNLIVTPEFIRRVLRETDNVVIHAGRVDRGTSPPEVLATIPGQFPERESGLNEVGYIVPGAGGLGEVINNAWV